MNLEQLYQNEIDFEVLKTIASHWGELSDAKTITFYAGSFGRPYVLLMEIEDKIPDVFIELRAKYFLGFNNCHEEQRLIQKAQHPRYNRIEPFFDNWYFFSHVDTSGEYKIGGYSNYSTWHNSDNPQLEKVKVSKNMMYWPDGTQREIVHGNKQTSLNYFPFLNHAIDSADFKDYDNWILTEEGFQKFIMSENPIVLYDTSVTQSIASFSNKKQDQITIPVPDGTQWGQIKFRYVNDDITQVSYPGGGGPFSTTSLGLASKPLLFKLFKLFAKEKGTLLPTKKAIPRVKANVSNFRDHLKSLFPGISGKPIRDYKKGKGWECNFQIESYESDSDSEPKKKSDVDEIISDSQKIPAQSNPKCDSHE